MTTETTLAKKLSTARAANVALLALVKELTAILDGAEARLGPEPPALTTPEKRRRSKPRKGAERVLIMIAPIVQQHGLDSASLNTVDMLARYDAAQTLVPLKARLTKMFKRVDDELFNAQTDAWKMGLQFYSLLQRRAKANGDIANSIAPLVKVFSYRHPGAKKQTKEATRVKAQLTRTLAIAQKHGVSVTVAPDGGVAGIVGAPAAVAAAQAELATGGVTVATQETTPAQTVATQGAGSAGATPVANGGAGVAAGTGGAVVPVAAPVSAPGVVGH